MSPQPVWYVPGTVMVPLLEHLPEDLELRPANEMPPDGNLFRYLRYDVRLELPWIEEHMGAEVKAAFGRNLTELDVIRMRSMDDPTIVEPIYKLAKIAAEKQVKAEHWVDDVPSWCDGTAQSAAAARKEAARQMRAPPPPSALAQTLQVDQRGPEQTARPAGSAAEPRPEMR